MSYLNYDEKIYLLGLVYDAMQSLYTDHSFYIKPTKTGEVKIKQIYKYAREQQANPIYILSCLFERWTYINRNHKTKNMKVLAPSAITMKLVKDAYLNDLKFEKEYNHGIGMLFNRSNLLVSGASGYFEDEDKWTKENLQEWLHSNTESLFFEDDNPAKEQIRQQLISTCKGNYHRAVLLEGGILLAPSTTTLIDKEVYELAKKDLLLANGMYDGKLYRLDLYQKTWYAYLDKKGRLLTDEK